MNLIYYFQLTHQAAQISMSIVNMMMMFMISMMLDHEMEMSPSVLDVLIRAPLNVNV